jgi:hypothetical protein
VKDVSIITSVLKRVLYSPVHEIITRLSQA